MWSKVLAWLTPDGDPIARPYPTALQSVDVSGDLTTAGGGPADYESNPLKALHVGNTSTGGIVYLKFYEDSSYIAWECVQGQRIDGLIVGVGGATLGTTATGLIGQR
jgi:hypothetical protein